MTGGIPSDLEQMVIDLVNQIPVCTDGEVDNSNPCNPFECYDGKYFIRGVTIIIVYHLLCIL